MLYYAFKIIMSALLIVAVSEIAKRHTAMAALLAALPLTSLAAFIWMHLEAEPAERIAALSGQIFWMVLPSLALFLFLPLLLRQGFNFWLSLGAASTITVVLYFVSFAVLRRYGVHL